jgi:hypothetical protein
VNKVKEKENSQRAGKERKEDALEERTVEDVQNYYTLKINRKVLSVIAGILLIFLVSLGAFAAGYYTSEAKNKLLKSRLTAPAGSLAEEIPEDFFEIPQSEKSQKGGESFLPDFPQVGAGEAQTEKRVFRGSVKSVNSSEIVLSTFEGEISVSVDENTKVSGGEDSSLEELVEGTRILIVAEPVGDNQFLAKRIVVVPEFNPDENL